MKKYSKFGGDTLKTILAINGFVLFSTWKNQKELENVLNKTEKEKELLSYDGLLLLREKLLDLQYFINKNLNLIKREYKNI